MLYDGNYSQSIWIRRISIPRNFLVAYITQKLKNHGTLTIIHCSTECLPNFG